MYVGSVCGCVCGVVQEGLSPVQDWATGDEVEMQLMLLYLKIQFLTFVVITYIRSDKLLQPWDFY